MGGELGETPAPDLLVQLGQFSGDGGGPVAEEIGQIGEAAGEPRGALEENQARREAGPAFERAPPCGLARRQKTGEEKGIGRQAGKEQRGQHCRWARDHRDRQVFGNRRLDQLVAGIGYERRSGVRNQGDPLPPAQCREHRRPPLLGVVLVVFNQRSRV